jgi:hypothetical protein
MYVSFSKRCRFQLNLIKLLNVGFVNNVLTNPKAELLKVFNLPPSKILSFYIFLKMNANHAFQNCKNCVSQNLLLNPSSHQFSTILLKPPSITSQIANLPHGWNPHTRSFFATLSQSRNYIILYQLCDMHFLSTKARLSYTDDRTVISLKFSVTM